MKRAAEMIQHPLIVSYATVAHSGVIRGIPANRCDFLGISMVSVFWHCSFLCLICLLGYSHSMSGCVAVFADQPPGLPCGLWFLWMAPCPRNEGACGGAVPSCTTLLPNVESPCSRNFESCGAAMTGCFNTSCCDATPCSRSGESCGPAEIAKRSIALSTASA
jgi:hypothetical protein